MVCGTIKLCQPRGGLEGALKFQEQPPAPADPAQDLAQLAVPFINGVPLLLQPQDLPHAQVLIAVPLFIAHIPVLFWCFGLMRVLEQNCLCLTLSCAAIILQDTGDLCEDCARLVAAVQLELSNGATTARSLMARAKEECEGLGPVLAQRVMSLHQGHPSGCWGWEVAEGSGGHRAPACLFLY